MMKFIQKNEREVVLVRFINAGTIKGYENLILCLAENYGKPNEYIHYDRINYNNLYMEDLISKLNILTGGKYEGGEIEDLIGTVLKIERSVKEVKGYSIPHYTYMERISFNQDANSQPDCENFDVNKDCDKEEMIDSFTPFVQKLIRNSDEYGRVKI